MDILKDNKKLLTAYLIVIMAFLMQACARQLSPEEPCNFVQNSQKQRISWENFEPATLHIHESVPEELRGAIKDAAESWNKLRGRNIIVISDVIDTGDNESRTDGRSVIYNKVEWEEDRQEEQARTQVRWRGSRILEADVLLNDVNFEFSTDEDVPDDMVDLKSLMIHEFGHVLGLDHIENRQTVMFRTLSKGQDRRDFSHANEEYHSLLCEY